MGPSDPQPQVNIWMRRFWDCAICLSWELVLFIVIKLLFRIPWGGVLRPYITFAVPTVIFFLLVVLLNKWERRTATPRWLALGWGLSVALFASMLTGATAYSGLQFRFIGLDDLRFFGVVGLVVVLSASIPAYQSAYRSLLARISARVAKNTGGARPQ